MHGERDRSRWARRQLPLWLHKPWRRSVIARAFGAPRLMPRKTGAWRARSEDCPSAGSGAGVIGSLEHSRPVLNGERRQMCIGNEVGARVMAQEQPPEHLAMPLGGLWNPCHRATEPSLRLMPSARYGLGTLEDPWVGHQAQERDQRRPRKPYGQRAVQAVIEPRRALSCCANVPRGRRREGWRRAESPKGFALSDRERLGDVVEIADQAPAQRTPPRCGSRYRPAGRAPSASARVAILR